MALLAADHERSATVEALEPGETLSVVRREFQRLQARHPGVMTAVAVILTHRVSRLSRRVLMAHYLDSDARARWAVAELADLYCSDVGSPAVVPLTQEQIAEFAGSSRATVNRVLREEQERRVVRLERGRVTDLDAAALRRRARTQRSRRECRHGDTPTVAVARDLAAGSKSYGRISGGSPATEG